MSKGVSRRGMFGFMRDKLAAGITEAAEAEGPSQALQDVSPGAQAAAQAQTSIPRRRVIPILRPPGALDEAAFLEACTRCGDCAKACPHDIILPVSPRLKSAAGTPTFDPAAAPCRLCEDVPCAVACPTEALDPARGVMMGTARINPLDCLAPRGGCWSCSEHCPIPWVISAKPGKVPQIDAKTCTGCGLCAFVCPAPTNAIILTPRQITLTTPAPTGPGAADSKLS